MFSFYSVATYQTWFYTVAAKILKVGVTIYVCLVTKQSAWSN